MVSCSFSCSSFVSYFFNSVGFCMGEGVPVMTTRFLRILHGRFGTRPVTPSFAHSISSVLGRRRSPQVYRGALGTSRDRLSFWELADSSAKSSRWGKWSCGRRSAALPPTRAWIRNHRTKSSKIQLLERWFPGVVSVVRWCWGPGWGIWRSWRRGHRDRRCSARRVRPGRYFPGRGARWAVGRFILFPQIGWFSFGGGRGDQAWITLNGIWIII